MLKNWQKFLIILILLSLSLFYPLHIAKAEAGWLLVIKEYGLDTIARIIARVLLSRLGNGITDAVLKAGRNGGPAFIQDWRDFFQKGQYRGEDIFRGQLASAIQGPDATVCPYMRSQLGTIFNVKSLVPGFDPSAYRIDSLQYFNTRNRCTLPAGLDVTAFGSDFTQGGWSAWKQLIQPQNNFYGTYDDSVRELLRQRAFEEKSDKNESLAGNGFTSKRDGCTGTGANRQCTLLGKAITPGSLLSDSAKTTINTEFDWLTNSDELEEVLISVVGTLTAKLSNYVVNKIQSPPKSAELGADSAAATSQGATNPIGQSAGTYCTNACVIANCPASQPACFDTTGDGIPDDTSSCASPQETEVRQTCINKCQTQGCQ